MNKRFMHMTSNVKRHSWAFYVAMLYNPNTSAYLFGISTAFGLDFE